LENLFSSVLSQFKKYHHPGNLKFNNLVIFQSLKLRISMEKILSISLKLNFSPNTLGCYGLKPPRILKPITAGEGALVLCVEVFSHGECE